MSSPYYDQKLSREDTEKLLKQLKAKHSRERSKPGIMVYKLSGEGEGMVERAAGDKLRVRLFKGRCAC